MMKAPLLFSPFDIHVFPLNPNLSVFIVYIDPVHLEKHLFCRLQDEGVAPYSFRKHLLK